MPAAVGTIIDHYRLIEEIGEGGKGVVYRAHDVRLDRDVALKFLKPETLQDPGSRRRFRHEALALSRLSHPNVAVIHDHGTYDGTDYLVMEHVSGRPLNSLAAPLPEREVLHLGVQLARGLEAAHAAGLVHRDVKPGNARVTPDGTLKLLDFGLALRLPRAEDETATDTSADSRRVEGTPPYMAPEQLRGEPADARTDIYGAGAVLYELVTGRPPFQEEQLFRLADRILHDAPPAVRALNPAISGGLEQVIVKALDREPSRRYQSAREMAVDLERLLSPITPMAIEAPAPTRRGMRLGAWLAMLAVVALVALASSWMLRKGWRTTPDFTPGDRLLIAEFDNEAGEGFGPLRQLLTAQMLQSAHVQVFEPQHAIESLVTPARDKAPIDERTGLQICRSEGVKLLLTGRIEPAGDRARVEIRVVDAISGRTAITEEEGVAGEGDLPRAADALGRRIRERLGESRSEIEASQPLADVTSHSPAAIRKYAEAVSQLDYDDTAEAARLLTGAMEADPSFTVARYLLARIQRGTGHGEEERRQIEIAYRERARLPTRWRLLIEAAYFSASQRYREARDTLDRLAGIYKNDWRVRLELASAYAATGDDREAIRNVARAVDLNPRSASLHGYLILELALAGETQEALAQCRRARALGVRGGSLESAEARALLAARDIPGARTAFERLARSDDPVLQLHGRIFAVQVDLFLGRFRASASHLVDQIEVDRTAGQDYAEHLQRYTLGRVYLALGQRDEALAQGRRLASSPVAQGEHLASAGLLLARGGDLAAARQAAARLRRSDPREPGASTAYTEGCARFIDGEIAAAEGRWTDAEVAFRQAAASRPGYLSLQGLARIYERTNRWPDTVRAWERMVGPMGGDVMLNGFAADWVLAQIALGAAKRRAGDREGAQLALETALRAWQDGDEVEALRRGKEEWRALTGRPWEPSRVVGRGNLKQ